jgi:hypothetical protein
MAGNLVIFLLSRSGIVGLEIREVGSCVAGDTVADLSGRQFSCRGRGRRRFRQEHLQAGQFLRSKREGLGMKLKLPIGSIRI